jgi:hypothetical protein
MADEGNNKIGINATEEGAVKVSISWSDGKDVHGEVLTISAGKSLTELAKEDSLRNRIREKHPEAKHIDILDMAWEYKEGSTPTEKTAIKKPKIEITKEDFEAYEAVRESGVTNMFAVDVVEDLSGLSRQKITAIMGHYSELTKQYPDVREQ